MAKHYKWTWSVSLLLCLIAAGVRADESLLKPGQTVKLSIIYKSLSQTIPRDVVREAYKTLGVHVEFNYFPPRRALELANRGIMDGETARIDGAAREFPNLIKIPVPVAYFTGVVFTKQIDRVIRTWEDLRGLKIGIVKGVLYSERGTKGMNTYDAKDNNHLFKLLDNDRIDVAIAVKEEGLYEIQKNFRSSNIHIIGQPVFTAPSYHYIHKKNKKWEPQLESVLHDMANKGEMKRLCQQRPENPPLPPV